MPTSPPSASDDIAAGTMKLTIGKKLTVAFVLFLTLAVGIARIEGIDLPIAATLTAGALLMLAVLLLIRRTVTRPVNDAAAALRRFAEGERDVRLATNAGDEIGDLARAFNRTAAMTDGAIRELATKSAILDETSDFVATFDAQGTLLYINPAGSALLGREAEPMRGVNLAECMAPWAWTVITQDALPTAARLGGWIGETALMTRDGREIPVSQVVISHRSADGAAGFSTIVRDLSDRIAMETRLTQSRDFCLNLFHDFPAMIWRAGRDGGCDYFNKTWLDFTGRPLAAEMGDGWTAGVHPDDRGACLAGYSAAREARRSFEMEYRLRRHDGAWRWVFDCGAPFLDLDGEFGGYIGSCYDITPRKEAEAARRASEERLEDIVGSLDDVVWSVDPDSGVPTFVSSAVQRVHGRPAQDFIDNPQLWRQVVHQEDRARVDSFVQELAARGQIEMEYRILRADGGLRWLRDRARVVRDAQGRALRYDGIVTDITERKRYEEQLQFQATHDALTGLPNRSLLGDRIAQALVRGGRDGRSVAVLFIDLDQFKFVNDSLGHDVGDLLLRAVSDRLRSTVREGDTVARQGGDEFVIVLHEVARETDVAEVAQKVLTALHPPFVVEDHELFVAASVGISLYPQDGEDVHTLLRAADMAMYRAKEEGRNNFQFFAADMNARLSERLTLEGSLRHALEREEFALYYQPQVDLASGQVVGMEALLRWRHPELGLVPPVKFIPLAEETGLIVAIGAWVLKKACAQNKAWQDAGLPRLTVAVNLSARQFRRSDLVHGVLRVLEETGLPARCLDLELTEGTIMHDPERVADVLQQLSDMGVQLSVDDFGTGYSSLGYLKRFPIDKVKIDQSFVRDVTSDPDDAAIAKTIVSIAHDMRMKVIAEGTETEGQVEALRSYGCDEIQGYLFSRPLPADEFEALLRTGRRLESAGARPRAERTLLLVDDEANVLNAITRLLRPEGYRILRAESGEAALDLLATNKVGVILSDQRMPGMSGVEFLRRAKQIHPDTVRMVLSGYTELKSVTDAINEGSVYKFLTKPWDDDRLRAHIREGFQRYELRAENERLARELEQANAQLSRSKGELETEIRHSLGALRVSQEMLERLPIGTLGIDGEGVVVAANRKAEEILEGGNEGPLIGAFADERLPAPMLEALAGAPASVWVSPQGRSYRFSCASMGEASGSQGTLLTIVPQDGETA